MRGGGRERGREREREGEGERGEGGGGGRGDNTPCMTDPLPVLIILCCCWQQGEESLVKIYTIYPPCQEVLVVLPLTRSELFLLVLLIPQHCPVPDLQGHTTIIHS